MAKCRTTEVEKNTIHLDLTVEEAELIMSILSLLGGDNPARQCSNNISNALTSAGISRDKRVGITSRCYLTYDG